MQLIGLVEWRPAGIRKILQMHGVFPDPLHIWPAARESVLDFLVADDTPLLEIHQKHLPRLKADRKSTRLNSSHVKTSYAIVYLQKTSPKINPQLQTER